MADYQTFIQKNGPRKGQKYRVKRGASGVNVRVYESGDTALQDKPKQPDWAQPAYAKAQKRRYNPNAR